MSRENWPDHKCAEIGRVDITPANCGGCLIVESLESKIVALEKELAAWEGNSDILKSVLNTHQAIKEEHSGDCTNEPHSCQRCQIEKLLEIYEPLADAIEESINEKLDREDILKAKLERAREALQYVLDHGPVDEGEGVWLGHSGQLEIQKAIAEIDGVKLEWMKDKEPDFQLEVSFMTGGESKECFARCGKCDKPFSLGCVVPCPIDVYIAAGRAARCPNCGEKEKIFVMTT